MKFRKLPSLKRIIFHYNYDGINGCITWNLAAGYRPLGGKAGSFRKLVVDGVYYEKSRIIWKIMTGEDPSDTVDHRDGNVQNICWDNLRLASQSQQNINRKLKSNSTGHRGVYENHPGQYRILVSMDNVDYWRYGFKNLDEAVTARKILSEKLQGEFIRD